MTPTLLVTAVRAVDRCDILKKNFEVFPSAVDAIRNLGESETTECLSQPNSWVSVLCDKNRKSAAFPLSWCRFIVACVLRVNTDDHSVLTVVQWWWCRPFWEWLNCCCVADGGSIEMMQTVLNWWAESCSTSSCCSLNDTIYICANSLLVSSSTLLHVLLRKCMTLSTLLTFWEELVRCPHCCGAGLRTWVRLFGGSTSGWKFQSAQDFVSVKIFLSKFDVCCDNFWNAIRWAVIDDVSNHAEFDENLETSVQLYHFFTFPCRPITSIPIFEFFRNFSLFTPSF